MGLSCSTGSLLCSGICLWPGMEPGLPMGEHGVLAIRDHQGSPPIHLKSLQSAFIPTPMKLFRALVAFICQVPLPVSFHLSTELNFLLQISSAVCPSLTHWCRHRMKPFWWSSLGDFSKPISETDRRVFPCGFPKAYAIIIDFKLLHEAATSRAHHGLA